MTARDLIPPVPPFESCGVCSHDGWVPYHDGWFPPKEVRCRCWKIWQQKVLAALNQATPRLTRREPR